MPGQSPLNKKFKPRSKYIKRRWRLQYTPFGPSLRPSNIGWKMVLLCVDQKIQVFHKELTKTDETQVDLQTTGMSVDMRTKSLLETTKNTREHLHKELSLMIQCEAQMTKKKP
jgi:hypothetical protein